ncbi:MAG TPA: hypothetical protein VEB18_03450 [Candidatus Paceibacterota bacterium]|nr:hypothetical protein [Candidatus Paceibacterota bacterium]
MRVYHATKTECSLTNILEEKILLPGRNVVCEDTYVHLSLNPFHQGSYALDVIGEDTNRAWVIECEIPDDTPLAPDPADNAGAAYNGGWVIHGGPLSITEVISVLYIQNVQRWEMGDKKQARYVLGGSS